MLQNTTTTNTRRSNRGLCHLMCGRPGELTCCSYRLCGYCVGTVLAIAKDAGVVVDEELITGGVRKFERRAFTRAERKLEQVQERRAIARALA